MPVYNTNVVAPAYAPQLMVTQANPTNRIGPIELRLRPIAASKIATPMHRIKIERTTQSIALTLYHIARGNNPNNVETIANVDFDRIDSTYQRYKKEEEEIIAIETRTIEIHSY